MKKALLILITIISFSACSLDDDTPERHFEYIAVTEVDIPNEFTLDETYDIIVSYTLPNSCYSFYNFDYIYDDTSREIYTYAIVNDDVSCTQTTIDSEYIISINASQHETYTFKFWQGSDNQGNDEFLIIEVPVI
jgi:hypothetical protein